MTRYEQLRQKYREQQAAQATEPAQPNRYDRLFAMHLEDRNKEAAGRLNQFQQKAATGAYMTQQDLDQYQADALAYIKSGSSLRDILKKYGQEDAANTDRWQSTMADISTSVGKYFDLYGEYETEDAWKQMQESMKAYDDSLSYDVAAGKQKLTEMQNILSGTYAADKDAVTGYALNPEASAYSEHQIRAMSDAAMALEDKYGFTDAADLKRKISEESSEAFRSTRCVQLSGCKP